MSQLHDTFNRILDTGFQNLIQENIRESCKDKLSRFRGANTPLFIGDNFCIDSTAHCPRVALLRKWGISERPALSSILSWGYGRLWEDVVKSALNASGYDLNVYEEEQCQVNIEGEEGELIYSMRPDLYVVYQDMVCVFELKTMQSDKTALMALAQKKPKLGAACQLAVAMINHELTEGMTMYGLQHYISGYENRQRYSFQPCWTTHNWELVDGTMMLNGQPSCVTEDAITTGLEMLVELDRAEQVWPERPTQIDVLGKPNNRYSQCTYCAHNNACLQFDGLTEIAKQDFIESVMMEGLTYDINSAAR